MKREQLIIGRKRLVEDFDGDDSGIAVKADDQLLHHVAELFLQQAGVVGEEAAERVQDLGRCAPSSEIVSGPLRSISAPA